MMEIRRSGFFPAWLLTAVVVATATVQLQEAQAEEPSRGGGVRGRVVDQDGKPITGARVSWTERALRFYPSKHEATTDVDGQFVLEGVTRLPTVLVAVDSHHAPETKTLPVREKPEPVEFRLGPGHRLCGRVNDTWGKPIARMPISVYSLTGDHPPFWEMRTDADGRFAWDGAPAHPVIIHVGASDFPGKSLYRVTPDGLEEDLIATRPVHVRGRVFDAQTGRPIKKFKVVPGGSPINSREKIAWQVVQAREFSGLSYEMTLAAGSRYLAVRIEADGYRPAVSSWIKSDEEDAIAHVALQPTGWIEGVARFADGSPMAGAEVACASPSHPVRLHNGRFPSGFRVYPTETDGRFKVPAEDLPVTLVAIGDRGYALIRVAEKPKAPVELKVEPWARVEGRLVLDGRPAPGHWIGLERRVRIDGPAPIDGVSWSYTTMTDAEGRFDFDRVRPGTIRIARGTGVDGGPGVAMGANPSAIVGARPGTTRIDLGATGRAIVGKAILPGGIAPHTWISGYCHLAPRIERDDVPTQDFRVRPDGTFRIEGVPPGTYELVLFIQERQGRDGVGSTRLASARRELVVPSSPGNRPIDLGSIRLEAPKK